MARARNLKPSFFTDDEVADLHPLARLLFQGLWCIADRDGRLEDKPRKIKAEVLPYDNANVERLLADLHESRFIVRYEHDGKKYIQVRQFKKHQNPHVKEPPSTIPAPGSTLNENSASTGQAPGKNNSSTGRDAEIPERAGLIVDSGFPLPDSGFRIADSPSPPPDPGLPPPRNAAPPGLRDALAQRGATAKPLNKFSKGQVNGHDPTTAAEAAVFELGKKLNVLPRTTEVFAEYEARVVAEGKAQAAAGGTH